MSKARRCVYAIEAVIIALIVICLWLAYSLL